MVGPPFVLKVQIAAFFYSKKGSEIIILFLKVISGQVGPPFNRRRHYESGPGLDHIHFYCFLYWILDIYHNQGKKNLRRWITKWRDRKRRKGSQKGLSILFCQCSFKIEPPSFRFWRSFISSIFIFPLSR